MPINPASMPGQTRRFAAAGLIVVAVGVSLWLFGRAEPQSSVAVVAAAEDWPAGREPGGFTIVEMPAESAALFVTVEQLIGRVPAVPVPAGTIVSASLLTDSSLPTASKLSATLLAVAVETALWPEPGPVAGDTAVLSSEPGGCATAVLPVVLTGENVLVVEAEPQLAALLGPLVWWIWESPPAGWPACTPGQLGQPDADINAEIDAMSDEGFDSVLDDQDAADLEDTDRDAQNQDAR